jgi:hypothetical protein
VRTSWPSGVRLPFSRTEAPSSPLQIGISIVHHDHDFVERRGGHVFFTHLRGAPDRARCREEALQRGERLYNDAVATGGTPERICGAGLIVLQRAVLAVDDLAVVLHALAEDDPEAAAVPGSDAGAEVWRRMVSMTIPDEIALFRAIAEDPGQALRAFRLPPDEVLAREPLTPAAQAAARRLRDRTARRWGEMLVRVARFWLAYGSAAKATMHGFAAIAGRQITEPPGAGFLGEHVRPPDHPFVVMVNSNVEGTNVQTPQVVVAMSPDRVRDFRRHGSTAVKLAVELCETLAEGIDRGYAYSVPPLLATSLSEADRDALAEVQPDEAAEEGP